MTDTCALAQLEFQQYLNAALESVDIAPDTAIVLEGSLAEGFGNGCSDLDFLAIEPGDRPTPLIPVIIFYKERRVELRVRSKREIQTEIAKLMTEGSAFGAAGQERVTFDELDRIQRFSRSVVYRSSGTLVDLKSQLSEALLAEATAHWFRSLTHRSLRCAVALEALNQWDAAAQWYRTAVEQATKLWLCARGETYLSLKWIRQQFARIQDENRDEIEEQFGALTSAAGQGELAADYIRACRSYLGQLGFDSLSFDPTCVRLGQNRLVTTWKIGGRVHVVRNHAEIFVLSETAASVWRRIDFTVPVCDLVESSDLGPTAEGRVLAEFHRLGFVSLQWGDGSQIFGRTNSSAVPSTARPVLSIRGAATEDGASDVMLVPLPPAHFAAAGIALVWANTEVENSREDALGALAAQQWGTLESAVRRIIRKCAGIVLCAHGMVSLASTTGGLSASSWQRREADEEACLRLHAVPGLPADLVEDILCLEATLSIADGAEGGEALARADAIVRRVRDVSRGSVFPSSFVSSREWRETLEFSYDWIRLAAYLDATFPLDEARDLVAVGHH